VSILLDALKKSEEQRRLGETPGVHSPADHDPDQGRRRLPRWLWLLAAVPVVLLAGWFARTWFETGEQPSVAETSAVSAGPAVSQRPPPATDGPQRALEKHESPAAALPRTPVEDYRAEQPGQESGSQEEADSQSEKRRSVNRSFTEFETPEPVTTAAAEEAAGPSPSSPLPEAAAEPQPPADNDLTGSRELEPVSFWALPQNVRSSLPEMRISVMVYAENPQDRFLLINGQRMEEGDSLSGVVLDEIRRDGAVFRYRNYRFLVEG
jgi:general secretion pathway protein B